MTKEDGGYLFIGIAGVGLALNIFGTIIFAGNKHICFLVISFTYMLQLLEFRMATVTVMGTGTDTDTVMGTRIRYDYNLIVLYYRCA